MVKVEVVDGNIAGVTRTNDRLEHKLANKKDL
jgi:hypothetical protein